MSPPPPSHHHQCIYKQAASQIQTLQKKSHKVQLQRVIVPYAGRCILLRDCQGILQPDTPHTPHPHLSDDLSFACHGQRRILTLPVGDSGRFASLRETNAGAPRLLFIILVRRGLKTTHVTFISA